MRSLSIVILAIVCANALTIPIPSSKFEIGEGGSLSVDRRDASAGSPTKATQKRKTSSKTSSKKKHTGSRKKQTCSATTTTSSTATSTPTTKTSSSTTTTEQTSTTEDSGPTSSETTLSSTSSEEPSTALPTSSTEVTSSTEESSSSTTETSSSTETTTESTSATETATPTTSDTSSSPSGSTSTQAGATPSTTVATKDDPYLTSLSVPINYPLIDDFTAKKTGGVMTYYAQGLGACGDTYDDSTYTAAISHTMYDRWPGADTGATNRNTVCGPFVEGRDYLTSSDEVVKGKWHALMGGDGLINCQTSDQCHVPLTATVRNPANNATLTVSIVDRCEGCVPADIDLTPAAFLKLSRPDLDTSGFALTDYMATASLDPQGRIPIEWSFDQTQLYKGVVGEMNGAGCVDSSCIAASA